MDFYVNLTYDQYKDLEMQCKDFLEGTHGDGTDYYHKSFAIYLGDTRIEFHGPNVKARKAEAEIAKVNPTIDHSYGIESPKPFQRSMLEDALRIQRSLLGDALKKFLQDAEVTVAYR